jgi:hypothetical protein
MRQLHVQLWFLLQLTPMYVKHTKTAPKTVSLMINPRGSKHVGENINYNIEYYFIKLCISLLYVA